MEKEMRDTNALDATDAAAECLPSADTCNSYECCRRYQMVHELVEGQVRRTPSEIAVRYQDECLTYVQLNSRANQLARYLADKGVASDTPVGICVDRSLQMIVGILAILKAGGAYVPLDPSYPVDRLAYMVHDSAPSLVLTHSRYVALLPRDVMQMEVDRDWAEVITYPDENLSITARRLDGRQLAYVIYTSGSTGLPKGVAMPHDAMSNLIEWHRAKFGDGSKVRVLQYAALSFDVAFQEIFTTLSTGGELVLPDEWERKDVQRLIDLLKRRAIARLFIPPLILQKLAERIHSSNASDLRAMKDVICAGEQLKICRDVTRLFQSLRGCRLHNHYGPTETHVVTELTMAEEPGGWPLLPSIGKPITNARIHILDHNRVPVPLGVVGEICIGGMSMARGYLGQPKLTAERFAAASADTESDSRLYRTGDLGRWQADGDIQCLGRSDTQVKIRGHRVELGEIEARLGMHADVGNFAVVTREDVAGDRRIIAYVTAKGGSDPRPKDLRAYLAALLPGFMVPSAIVVLESLPQTPNGKLDREALPPPRADTQPDDTFEPPRGEIEELIAGVWKELLGVDRVGREANFFELGGHSLMMMHMMERIRSLGFVADIRDFYKEPTLSKVTGALVGAGATQPVRSREIPEGCDRITPDMVPLVGLDAAQITKVVELVPGGGANIQDIYPLAPLQEGMLFHHLMSSDAGDTYIVTAMLAVSSEQRLNQLIEALQAVIDRHDSMRVAVFWEGLPRPVQVVHRKVQLPVEELTLQPGRDSVEQLKERMRPERLRLDPRRAPLIQLKVAVDRKESRWYALIHLHHLVCDHESLEHMFAEISAHVQGRENELPPAASYRDHVQKALGLSSTESTRDFFRRKLGDIDEPTIPFGVTATSRDSPNIEERWLELSAEVSFRIRAHARHLKVTPATLFHASWALVVALASGRNDVVFGTMLLGRLQADASAGRALGMFMNTLPLRISLQGLCARELIERTHTELTELLAHEQDSLAVAQRCSGIAGATPVFTALLNYRHTRPRPEHDPAGRSFGIKILDIQERTNYPLALTVDDIGQGFALMVQADRRIDGDRVLKYVSVSMQSLLDASESSSRIAALRLPVLTRSEHRRVVETFNQTRKAYDHQELIHELIELHANRSPNSVAIICGTSQLTYGQLNRRANQLARLLIACGAKPEERVVTLLERGVEVVVAWLATLKAGAAYVPLDLNYPIERIGYVLSDSRPVVIITQQRFIAKLPPAAAPFVLLDRDQHEIARRSDIDLNVDEIHLHRQNLAYVIYTSGSTGRPKGVMVQHCSVRNLISWHVEEFSVQKQSRCSCVAAVGFDAAGWEIWPALCAGATLTIAPAPITEDLEKLLAWWKSEPIDVGFLPTPIAEVAFHQDIRHPTLRALLVGGDRLRHRSAHDGCALINNYGPTETTVVATSGCILPEDETIHIGRPVANTQIYILTPELQPVPVGVIGEVYIGGLGVARAYLNRPELTVQRFIANPFDDDTRLYRSGDLARWREDGTVDYVGRNDHQVKLRGLRIELGEIEAVLLSHSRVQDAVVLARADTISDGHLVAYVIPERTPMPCAAPDPAALRSYLQSALPEYMVPSAFVLMDHFPLTVNGKIDRRALPPPDLASQTFARYEEPQGRMEGVVSRIWGDLLGVDRVGRHDDFFDLGGNSLVALRAISRVRDALACEISLSALFEHPTVSQFAMHVEELQVARLQESVESGGIEMRELLERVAALTEDEARKVLEGTRAQ